MIQSGNFERILIILQIALRNELIICALKV